MGTWDFRGKSNNEYTHDLHQYPAKLNPSIARKLIKDYGGDAENLLDPFCGSGTTLVEARLAGLDAIGFDINPTAKSMSLAKSQNYDLRRLRSFVMHLDSALDSMELMHWQTAVKRSGFGREEIKTWYPNKSIREIASSIELIRAVDAQYMPNRKHRLFATVALSDCLREVSIQRMGEWKNYRIKNWRDMDINDLYQDLVPLFKEKLNANLASVCSYIDELKLHSNYNSTNVVVDSVNSVYSMKSKFLPKEGIDLVVTSPPYGDSPTTVAYEQFSWLSNVWLGLDNRTPGRLGSEMMGGQLRLFVDSIGQRSIDSAISKMKMGFAMKNYAFYRDYLESIRNVADIVKVGGHVCYVVGNRTSGDQYMRLDLFTRWAFEKNGFKRVGKIRNRKLTNTKMPGAIAVTENGQKKIVPTMKEEFIVVCKKS